MTIKTKITVKDVFIMNWDISCKQRFTFLKLFFFSQALAIILAFFVSLNNMTTLKLYLLFSVLVFGLTSSLFLIATLSLSCFSSILGFFFNSYSVNEIELLDDRVVEKNHQRENTEILFEDIKYIFIKRDAIYLGFAMGKVCLIKINSLEQLNGILSAMKSLLEKKDLKIF